MTERLDDWLSSDPDKQAALFDTAMNFDNQDDHQSASLAQGIIVRQNVTLDQVRGGYAPPANVKPVMMTILAKLLSRDKAAVPHRAIFAVGSVAYSHFDAEVRKAAADLLVRWAVPTPPPAG